MSLCTPTSACLLFLPPSLSASSHCFHSVSLNHSPCPYVSLLIALFFFRFLSVYLYFILPKSLCFSCSISNFVSVSQSLPLYMFLYFSLFMCVSSSFRFFAYQYFFFSLSIFIGFHLFFWLPSLSIFLSLFYYFSLCLFMCVLLLSSFPSPFCRFMCLSLPVFSI